MYYSTRETARIMSEKGLLIEAATLRLYHKLGVFVGRKTSRGDLVYSADDLVRLASVIEARRAARLEALRRATRCGSSAPRFTTKSRIRVTRYQTMASSKEIGLTIKGIDLASKPIQDIGAAVDKLVQAVGIDLFFQRCNFLRSLADF
jgi:hypothetical protein